MSCDETVCVGFSETILALVIKYFIHINCFIFELDTCIKLKYVGQSSLFIATFEVETELLLIANTI